MTKNEKLLVCFLLLFIETKCLRSPNTYSQYFEHFNPQVNFQRKLTQIPSEQQRSQTKPPSFVVPPPRQNYWAFQSNSRFAPPNNESTTRILPKPPTWLFTTTTTTTTIAPPETVTEWNLISEKKRTLKHISDNIIVYFMRVAVQDFLAKMLYVLKNSNFYIDRNEEDILDERCSQCSEKELQNYLNSLLIIMEKYPPLIGNVTLADHVATEYERACDILNKKLRQFKVDVKDLSTIQDFNDLRRQYARKERNGGIMSLLLNWFETYSKNGSDDVKDIQIKLMKHLTSLKRYWLINITGII